MVCCFGVIVACFHSSLFFMGASLPPDFPLWFYFPISKRTHFLRHLLAFSNPCPSLSLGCGPGKQQALMLETKALKKQSFQKSSQGRGEARPQIVKVWERPLDKGCCSLSSASSWLRTRSSKAFPCRWAVRNQFLEVSPSWSRNTKGPAFLKWVFWELQSLEKV